MRVVQIMPLEVWAAAERRLSKLRGIEPSPPLAVSSLVETVRGLLATMGYDCEPASRLTNQFTLFRSQPLDKGLRLALVVGCKSGPVEVTDVQTIIAQFDLPNQQGYIVTETRVLPSALAAAETSGRVQIFTLASLYNELLDFSTHVRKLVDNYAESELAHYYVDLGCVRYSYDDQGRVIGQDRYKPIDGYVDAWLRERGVIRLPVAILADGSNTRQAINYNYRAWRDFFNDRQLIALGWLQQAISQLPDASTRDALFTLFSGALEFNNLFASYKGEGTGAVRHTFSHHILKPERAPIEANVWGTPKSSGSFSNLFETRLLRAPDYRAAPFEVTVQGSGKAHRSSVPFSGSIETVWPIQGNLQPRAIYLSCGSSDETHLPDRCVDLIVTDPPFFDNVHYSELADFFYAWQSLYQRGFVNGARTTRNVREVQDADADSFAAKLRAVLTECYRILKDDGLLVFTYHHSRAEGWTSVMEAVFGADLSIVEAHPVKAEMSVATPKSQAKEPIQLDIILVCKKRGQDTRSPLEPSEALDEAAKRAFQKLERLTSVGLNLSLNDRRIVLVSQFISALGPVTSASNAVQALLTQQDKLEQSAKDLPDRADAETIVAESFQTLQMTLPF